MWFSTLLFLTLCGGILCKSEDLCSTGISTACEPKEPFPWKFPKNAEDVDHLCPILLDRLTCMQRYTDECRAGVLYADDFQNIIAYITEVCNSSSNLRDDVLKQLPCIKEVVDDSDDTCTNLTREAMKAYKKHVPVNIKDDDFYYGVKHYCMYTIHETACFIVNVDRKCGAGAKNIVLDAQNRIGYLEKTCPAEESGELLELVEVLDIEMEQRDVIKEILLLLINAKS